MKSNVRYCSSFPSQICVPFIANSEIKLLAYLEKIIADQGDLNVSLLKAILFDYLLLTIPVQRLLFILRIILKKQDIMTACFHDSNVFYNSM